MVVIAEDDEKKKVNPGDVPSVFYQLRILMTLGADSDLMLIDTCFIDIDHCCWT